MGLCLCAEQRALPATGFPFPWEPAASMVEGGRCSRSLGPFGLLTCVVWSMLYLLSFKLRPPRTLSSERISSWEVDTWAGQRPAFLCHTPPLLLLLPRAHTNTCWLYQKKSSPVLSVKGPHIYFLFQPISVQISEFSMPGAGIPQRFIWSSMRLLEDV